MLSLTTSITTVQYSSLCNDVSRILHKTFDNLFGDVFIMFVGSSLGKNYNVNAIKLKNNNKIILKMITLKLKSLILQWFIIILIYLIYVILLFNLKKKKRNLIP